LTSKGTTTKATPARGLRETVDRQKASASLRGSQISSASSAGAAGSPQYVLKDTY